MRNYSSKQARHQMIRREYNQRMRSGNFSTPQEARWVASHTRPEPKPVAEVAVFVGIKLIDGKRFHLFKKPSEHDVFVG